MKLWLGICALLIFGAGLATGLLVRDGGPLGLAASGAPDRLRAAVETPRDVAVASILDPDPDYPLYLVTSDRVYETLKLTPEQRLQLGELFTTHLRRLREVRFEMASLAERLRGGIVSVLDEEQQETFARLQKEYSDEKMGGYVDRKIASLRQAVQLSLDQEAAVYGIIFDSVSKKKEIWCQRSAVGVERCRQQSDDVSLERDRALEEVLRPDQFAAYQRQQECERQWREKARRERERAHPEQKVEGGAGNGDTPPRT